MFSHTLKLILRVLYRDKLYASINIIGLALAIACCLILGLYLHEELTYDQHYDKHERIFRIAGVYEDYDTGNQRELSAISSPALGPLLNRDLPEIEAVVRIDPEDELLIRHGDEGYYWDKVFYADDNIFEIFSHEILYGDPRSALADPSSIAVSETFARQYFGDGNPLGEVLILESGDSRIITLVFADQPVNTHLKYDVLLSYNHPGKAIAAEDIPIWLFGASTYTYLLMPEGYEADSFEAISNSFFQRYMEDRAQEQTNRRWSGWLQPLDSIHLGPDLQNDQPTGNRFYLYGFMAVVVFILLIACINYMNLATAGYTRRAKEVGMRKILGAGRPLLVLQFLGEAMILVLVSVCVGVMVVELAISEGSLGDLLGRALSLDMAQQPGLMLAVLGLALALGLAAGLYPAFYLTSLRPLTTLAINRKQRTKKGELRLRECLVLLQFTISIGVIAATVLMAMQMRFISDRALGFDKENRVLVPLRSQQLVEQIPAIKQALLAYPRIQGVTSSTSMMGQGSGTNTVGMETNEGATKNIQMTHMAIDEDFIEVMGMELARGRNFSSGRATDASSAILVNEALAEYMAWEEPLGKSIQAGSLRASVIGVVEDFNFSSLHTGVEPFFMYLPEFDNPLEDRLLVVQVSGERVNATLGFIEETLASFDPLHLFEFSFLEAALDELYLSEERLMYLIGVFSFICIIITCLGLFGLAAFTAEQRTKEVGIRKVLGASRLQIILLFLGKTLLLGIAGAAIATLVTYPVMNSWLEDFAYRIAINPLVFPVSALMVVAVAYATMMLHSLRISNLNPVYTLRYE